MSLEQQIERLNGNVEQLIQIVSGIAQAAQQRQAQPGIPPQQPTPMPAAQPAPQPRPSPMAAPAAQPAPAAPVPSGVPGAPSAGMSMPGMPPQTPVQPAPGPQTAAPGNVVPLQPGVAPRVPQTREELNKELMAVVAQLGGGQAAAAQVMNLLATNYGTASLQGIPEDKFENVLNDARSLIGG